MKFNYFLYASLTFYALDRLHNWTTNKTYFCLSVFFDRRGNHCQKI